MEDWIWDVQWRDDHLLTISAHNVVHAWTFPALERISRTACEDNAMLYCARIFCPASTCMFAAGSVFGQILLWKPAWGAFAPPEAILRGHDGVIFNLEISADCKGFPFPKLILSGNLIFCVG